MPTQLFLAITTNEILIGVVALVVGVAIGWFAVRAISGGTIRLAKRDAQQIMEKAESESESLKQKIELDAEREAVLCAARALLLEDHLLLDQRAHALVERDVLPVHALLAHVGVDPVPEHQPGILWLG